MEEFTREEILEFRRLASEGVASTHGGCCEHALCLYDLLAKFPNDRKVRGRSKAAEDIEFRVRQIRRYLKLHD